MFNWLVFPLGGVCVLILTAMCPIRFDFCFYYNLNFKLNPKQSLLLVFSKGSVVRSEIRRLGTVPCLYHQLTP